MKESDVGRFLRLLTHDLQNVIGAVDLNLQVLPTLVPETSKDMSVLAPFVSRASLACSEMADLLADVQTFARSVSHMDDTGSTAPPVLSNFDLCARVRDTVLALSSSAETRSVQLKTSGSAVTDAAIEVHGDAAMITRAIRILVGEAIRGSFPGSTVEIHCLVAMVPTVEISTTQDGLFDDSRPTLARFLATQLLESSQARLAFSLAQDHSAVRISLPPA